VQLDVFRLVNDAHAATTKLLNYAVVRDGLSDHGKQNLTWRDWGESTKRGRAWTISDESGFASFEAVLLRALRTKALDR
jgi:hypothetical protein